MHIDAHQHFWKYDPAKHPWINDSMSIIQKDFLPGQLKPILDKNDFDACVAVAAIYKHTFFGRKRAGDG